MVKAAENIRLLELEHHEELKYVDKSLVAKRHIPATSAANGVISPVLARLVIINPNSDNVQYLDSYGVAKYMAKYIAGVDENHRIYICPPKQDQLSTVQIESEKTGNTKITSVNMVEKRKEAK